MSDLVGNPEDQFSHDEAHIIYLDVGITQLTHWCVLSTEVSKHHDGVVFILLHDNIF